MTSRAYSYLRFSTPEQMQGDSFRRQSSLAAEYAARHQLELDTQLTFHDLGVSAFRGKNAEHGALALFKEAVENGQVPKGSYLLVESLDRVSRAKPRKAVRILEGICESGVNVVTLSDGKVYNEDTLDSDGGMSLLMSVLIFIRANEESETKSRRVKASWTGRRQEAAKTRRAIFGSGPSWLKKDPETQRFVVIPEKAAVVRRVFAMAANGFGYNRIAHVLNDEGVPTLTAFAKCWRHTTVRHLLSSRTVLGEYTPHVLDHINGKRLRVPHGEPIQLYPAVISESLFGQVQENREDTKGPTVTAKRRGRPGIANIFAGLSVCARCGSPMPQQHKRSSSKGTTYHRYMVCTRARYGLGCRYTSVRYANIEDGFLRDLNRILARRPTGSGEHEAELARLEGPMAALGDRIEALIRGYERVRDPALLAHLTEARGELTILQERERTLASLIANTAGPVVQRRIEALREALEVAPKDPPRINLCIRALFAGLSINPDTGVATLGWRGGGESTFVFTLSQQQDHG